MVFIIYLVSTAADPLSNIVCYISNMSQAYLISTQISSICKLKTSFISRIHIKSKNDTVRFKAYKYKHTFLTDSPTCFVLAYVTTTRK